MLSSGWLISQMAKTGARLIKERFPQTNPSYMSKLVQVSKGDLAMNNDSLKSEFIPYWLHVTVKNDPES